MADNKLLISTVVVLWLFPMSVLFFFLTASLVPAYETKIGYFVSIFSFFFMLINAVGSLFVSFILCNFYSSLKGDGGAKALDYLKALVFNVFGGYHFIGKIRKLEDEKGIEMDKSFRVGFLGAYYIFFIVIAVVVSMMMSKGVGS